MAIGTGPLLGAIQFAEWLNLDANLGTCWANEIVSSSQTRLGLPKKGRGRREGVEDPEPDPHLSRRSNYEFKFCLPAPKGS